MFCSFHHHSLASTTQFSQAANNIIAFVPFYSTSLPNVGNNRLKTSTTCKRRVSTARRQFPQMLAKFQQKKEESGTSLPEKDPSKLEEVIPEPLLPTLTTLAGENQSVDTNSSTDNSNDQIDLSQISTQGAGFTYDEEQSIIGFAKGVVNEWNEVEWPSFQRVARLTVIVTATIVLAVLALYFVDGAFYRLSQILFEDKL